MIYSRKYPWQLHALVVTLLKIQVSHDHPATLVKVTWPTLPYSPFLSTDSEFLVHIVQAYAVDSSHAASFVLLDQTGSHNIQSCKKLTY